LGRISPPKMGLRRKGSDPSRPDLPDPSAQIYKIQPSVSFAESTKVLLGLIGRGNPEGRTPRNK